MLKAPSYCPNCNSFFIATLPFSGIDSVFMIQDLLVGCERCGGSARVFDGTYTDQIVDVVKKIGVTRADLDVFNAIIRDAKQRAATAADVAEAIESKAPKLSPLINFLKYDIALIPILRFIAAVISIFIFSGPNFEPERVTTENVYEEMQRMQIVSSDNRRRKAVKPGVNDTCPCGSGRKYKKCCQSKRK